MADKINIEIGDINFLLERKSYLKDYIIDAIKTAHSNFTVISEILEYEKLEVNGIEDKQEFLKGLEYKLKIGYDEWVSIILKEFIESLYINKRYILSLMETLEHSNQLLISEAKVYYSSSKCNVAPIIYCSIKRKYKLYKYKKLINVNEINSYKLEKVNVSNNNIIDKMESIVECSKTFKSEKND